MPRDAITLADVREAAIEIFCEPFARRGRYNLERLIAKHGADIRLAELRRIIADCRRRVLVSV